MGITTNPLPVTNTTGPAQPSRSRSSVVLGLLAYALILSVGFIIYLLTHSMVAAGVPLLIGLIAAMLRVGIKTSIGIFLLLMPLQWLVITLIHYFGVSQYQLISATKEMIIVAAILWLLYSSPRVLIVLPDILLVLILFVILFLQIFHMDFLGLRDDWEWLLLYMLGRLLVLQPVDDSLWAKCAVWMCAALAIVGIWEVEFLGSGPRVLLLQLSQGDTKLPNPFLAQGYDGFRAASTMDSPLAFSALCMVALMLWWTYMKNPIPALIIGAGLAFTLTRSAAAMAVLGCLVIGLRRKELVRIAVAVVIAVLGFLAAIPILNLSKYLDASFISRTDASEQFHRVSLIEGYQVMLDNPLGSGAGTYGPRQWQNNRGKLDIEDSYLTIAAEYGVITGLLYVSFVVSCLVILIKLHEPLGYVAFSILLGYALLLAQGDLHLSVPVACWVWVPVGMAINRAAETSCTRSVPFAIR